MNQTLLTSSPAAEPRPRTGSPSRRKGSPSRRKGVPMLELTFVWKPISTVSSLPPNAISATGQRVENIEKNPE